jgi:MFS transporter, FHS family, glucose/mannose:H+ symporter
MPIERLERVRSVRWLHFGFALTGMGTNLLGCILPSLGTIWHMNDDRAGMLFAAQFSGSALGALLVGSNFFSSVLRGYLLLIASAVSIAWFADSRSWLAFFSFGLGLGLTMTATSMLIGSTFVARRGAALSLLNASWAIGAALCPAIASLWISRESPTRLFLGLALALALVVTLIVIGQYSEGFSPGGQNAPKIGSDPKRFRLVLVFAVLAFLYVGVEVSVSGWMMAYVHRLVFSSKLWAPLATSFFWIALVCGRSIAPGVLKVVSEPELFAASLVIAFIGVVVLLLSQTPVPIVLSAALAGLALGPIFPLCLAAGLVAMNDSPRTKWIFAISGLGGAVLPWMTGKLSALHGSLRNGLIIPVLALSAMIILYRVGLRAGRLRYGAD